MDKLPVLSGREIVKVLGKAGFAFHHQKGSHIVLKRDKAPFIRVVVPDHKTVKRGMLRGIIKEAGLNREEFLKLLEK